MKTKSFMTAMLGLAVAVSLCSCETTGSTAGPDEAITCSKCQMVAYERTGTVNKQVTVLRGETMTCPDCKTIAANFYRKGGPIQHKCNSCGGTLTHCRAH